MLFLLPFFFDIATAVLSNASVTPASNIAGNIGNVVITFDAAAVIIGTGKIKVTFPAGYDLSGSLSATATGIANDVTPTDGGGGVLVITRSGGTTATSAGATLVITVVGIQHPAASTGSTFSIGAYAADGTTPTADGVLTGVTAVPIYAAAKDCMGTNNDVAYCGVNGCTCALGQTANDCATTGFPPTADIFAEFTTAKVAKDTSGTCAVESADYPLYFPGEEIVTVHASASKTHCSSQSRKDFATQANTAVDDNFEITPTSNTKLTVVAAGSGGTQVCGVASNGADAALLTKGDVLAHKADAATGKICQSLTYDKARKQEACTAAASMCDRYLDVVFATGSESCILKTTRVLAGIQALGVAKRCIAEQKQNAATDIGSANCSVATAGQEEWCNPGAKGAGGVTTAAQRCVPYNKKLGTAAGLDAGVRVEGTAADVICIGETYWGICQHAAGATKEVCNPYTATGANICLLKADVLGASAGSTTSGHGLTGTMATARAATAAKTYCIPKTTAAEEDCQHDEVCNWGSTAAADTCIPKNLLLGTTPAAGAGWTALGQVRQAAVALKYCFARSSATHAAATAYFAKICDHATATAEICNPNATADGDVCILATKVLDHGVKASTGTAPAPNKDHCIGDLAYKKTLATTAGAEEVCNWGAATSADSGIVVTELLDATKILESYRVDGAKNAATPPVGKWCFSKKTGTKSDAKKLAFDDTATADVDETEVCNPNGERGGATDEKKVNVLKKKVLAHGVAVTAAQVTAGENICIGEAASNACLENQACVYKTGACVDFATTENTILERFTAAEEGKITCFGASETEDCELTYICNPFGTTLTGGTVKVADAVETAICWNPDALAENGGYICPQFEEDEEEKTLENVTGAILCDADAPFCGTDGECTADETLKAPPVTGENAGVATTTVAAGTGDGTEDGTETTTVDHAATTPVWIGLAIAATLW